jgi:hypothetical protein
MSGKGPLNRRSLGCARDDKGGAAAPLRAMIWQRSEGCTGLPSKTWDGQTELQWKRRAPFVIPSAAEGSAVQRTFPGHVFRLPK